MSTLNVGTIQNLSTLTASGQVSVGGNLLMNSGYGSAATAYGCRAWVNFNGSTNTIRGSGNVTSVTKTGTGDYTLNFTTAMPDANYSAVISNSGPVNSNHTPPFLGQPGGNDGAAFSTTTLRISSYVTTNSGLRADPLQFCVTIFR
jgi:hypothetical protein